MKSTTALRHSKAITNQRSRDAKKKRLWAGSWTRPCFDRRESVKTPWLVFKIQLRTGNRELLFCISCAPSVEIKIDRDQKNFFPQFDFSKKSRRNIAESVPSTDFLDPDPSHKCALCILADCTKLW